MAFAVIGISALAVLVLLVLPLVGVPSSAFSSGALAVLRILPLPGLTIGLLLVLALIVVNVVARTRSQRR
jgi:ABC-type sulfate transport system permease subunit